MLSWFLPWSRLPLHFLKASTAAPHNRHFPGSNPSVGRSVHKCLTGIQISIHIFLNISIVVSSIFPLRSLLPGHTDKRHSPSCYDGRWRLRHQPAQFGWSHREWKFCGNQKPSLFVDLFLAALPTWKPHIPHRSTCCHHHNTGLP